MGANDEPIVFNSEEFIIIGIMPTSVFLEGDINGDSLVNIQDIILTVNLVLSNEYNSLADLNSDNIVDILDLVALVNIVLGN